MLDNAIHSLAASTGKYMKKVEFKLLSYMGEEVDLA
jgi:hypothetical protein